MAHLSLTLHRQWFDAIAAGEKSVEYREDKPYWQRRLDGRQYQEVHFRNGYQPGAPFMRVECRGISKNGCYQIHLGKIIEVKNY